MELENGKRSQLIIIGNGFDLAHGLPTSYSEFMLNYLINMLNELSDKGHYSDLSLEYTSYTKLDIPLFSNCEEALTYITLMESKRILIRKRKTRFMSELLEGINYGWVDIEKLYYRELLSYYQLYIKTTTKDLTRNCLAQLQQLNRELEQLKNNLSKYLLDVERKNALKPDIRIKNKFSTIKFSSNHNFMVLVFNYTKTIDIYRPIFGDLNAGDPVNYIHGSVHQDSNPIVFGYGDELDERYGPIENLEENEFLKYIKAFAYLENTNYDRILGFLESCDDNGFEVHMMGHSGGLSDRVLLNSVFEHAKCKKIRIYWNRNDNSDFVNKTMQMSRHFKLENKRLVRERIANRNSSEPLL